MLEGAGERARLRWVDLGAGAVIGAGVEVGGWVVGPAGADRRVLVWRMDGGLAERLVVQPWDAEAVADPVSGALRVVGRCAGGWTMDTAIPHPLLGLSWGVLEPALWYPAFDAPPCAVDPATERISPPAPPGR